MPGTSSSRRNSATINPTATLLSAAMLLSWLGRDVDAAIAAGDRLTPDVGGNASTTEFATAVRERL
jgi:3-isopropylmalate dehydrogenase